VSRRQFPQEKIASLTGLAWSWLGVYSQQLKADLKPEHRGLADRAEYRAEDSRVGAGSAEYWQANCFYIILKVPGIELDSLKSKAACP
jgi:hypothetical protein